MAEDANRAGVRVYLVNPGDPHMARRRRRTRRRRTSTRRRVTRRRRNPSLPLTALLIGGLGGLALGGADYALAGQDKIPAKWIGALEAAAGLLIGGITAMYQRDLGVGLAAGGIALGSANSARAFIGTSAEKTVATTGAIYGRPRTYAQLRAVQAPLGAVSAAIGQRNVDMSAVQAVLNSVGRQ